MTATRISTESIKKELRELTTRIINLNDNQELSYVGEIDAYDSGVSEFERQFLLASHGGLPYYYSAVSVCEQTVKYAVMPSQVEELSSYIETIKGEIKKLEKKRPNPSFIGKKVIEDRPSSLPILPPTSPTSSSSAAVGTSPKNTSTVVPTTATTPFLPKSKKRRDWFACSQCCGSADDVAPSSPRPGI